MTKKRFENRLNKESIKFATLNPVWDNERGTALNVFEMIEEMNELHELKEELLEVIDTLSDNRPNKKGFVGNGRFA